MRGVVWFGVSGSGFGVLGVEGFEGFGFGVWGLGLCGLGFRLLHFGV